MSKLFEDLKEEKKESSEEETLSVSEFLSFLNEDLKNLNVRVRGEVVDTDLYPDRSYTFFELQDPDPDENAKLNCFIWKRKYKMSDVDLEEGMEVIVEGYPKVYPPGGQFNLQTSTIELSGEGALMKAYQKLKENLKKKGVFSPENKQALPRFPKKIGLITAKGSDAEADFLSSLGNFGFEIYLKDSRVEGKSAVEDLVNAVDFFQDKGVDILVVTRGGGSVEALQAFDNKNVVEAVFESSIPVISGVGHHKDVPLTALAADKQASNPRDAAAVVTEPWKEARSDLRVFEKSLMSDFEGALRETRRKLESSSRSLRDGFEGIIKAFRKVYSRFGEVFANFGRRLQALREGLGRAAKFLVKDMDSAIERVDSKLGEMKKVLEMNDPNRALKLGYSLVETEDGLVRSVDDVEVGEMVDIRVSDGNISSEVEGKKKSQD